MTIKPGIDWGNARSLDHNEPIAGSDAQVAAIVAAARSDFDRPEMIRPDTVRLGTTGGDLHRTLGAPPATRMFSADGRAVTVDLLQVVIDDHEAVVAVAHVVIGPNRWWSHRTVFVMNVPFIGSANVAPRAHPNDGLVDVIDGRLDWSDRRQAHKRVGSGTHLPHPQLSVSRVRFVELEFERPASVRLDGQLWGRAHTIAVSVVPDAFTLVV